MFQNGTYIFYAFVACILFGIAKSQDNPETVSPHDITDLRQQLYIQDGNLNGKLASMGAIQTKTLEKLDTIKKEISANMESMVKETSANTDTTQKDGPWVPMDTPNQCGAFFRAALSLLFDHNEKVEEQLNILFLLIKEIRESQREPQENIKKEYQEKLEKIQQENQEQLNEIQQEYQEKLDRIQQEMQQNLDNIETTTSKAPEPTYIPPGFERLGSRYFYIENNIETNWTHAEESCRKMGGYLAAFRNQKEIDDIKPLLRGYYFLGINDREVLGQYLSVASGKPAPFLNWSTVNFHDVDRCATLAGNKMMKLHCNNLFNFICQLDDKV